MSLYINGVLDAQMHATGVLSPRMGGVILGGPYPFSGSLDDVRIYREALEPEIITAFFTAGHEKQNDSLIARVRNKHTTAVVGDRVAMKTTVVCTSSGNKPVPFNLNWSATEGPGTVQFIPNQTVADPCAIFTKPSLYKLMLCVETNECFSSDSALVVVYPPGFNGLLAHYQFNQGNARDSASLELHGQLIGNARVVNDPNRGQVLDLDGKGDFVDCGNHVACTVTDRITVAAWIKVHTFDKSYQAIVSKGDGSWRLQRYKGDTLQFAGTGLMVEGTEFGDVVGTVNVNDGKWHHAVGVYDGARISLYIDGKLDNYKDASGLIHTNDHPVFIGESANSRGREWDGLIDDVRIYNRAFSAEAIADLYNATQ